MQTGFFIVTTIILLFYAGHQRNVIKKLQRNRPILRKPEDTGMVLEIRTPEGQIVADIKGVVALTFYQELLEFPDAEKTTKNIEGKRVFDVFVMKDSLKFSYGEIVVWMAKGYYIKIIP